MKIIFIRHADPDYSHDCLTIEGSLEAKALAEHYRDLDFLAAFSSPLPRAKLTAMAFMAYHPKQKLEVKEWLEEFCRFPFHPPYAPGPTTPWDLKPSYYAKETPLFDLSRYFDDPLFKGGEIKAQEKKVTDEFDDLLTSFGYRRKAGLYEVSEANHGTLVFFTHFGAMSVLVGHLLHIPYLSLAQGLMAAPSSVTTLVSEEREKGLASFRMLEYGATAHLLEAGLKPSFAGRFCECCSDETRHD